MQDSEVKDTNMDEVQTEYKRIQRNPAEGMDDFVVCCRGISDVRRKAIKVHNR